MEATVDKLEAMYNKTESDLDLLSNKLVVEFGADENAVDLKENPAKMLQKIVEIKQEYAAIVQEAQAIRDAQMEAMQFFKEQLSTTCQGLMKLQTDSGMPTELPEELSQMEVLLGIPARECQAAGGDSAAESGPGAAVPTSGLPSQQHLQASPSLGSTSSGQTEAGSVQSKQEPLSAYERRLNSDEMIEIDQVEFESVSSLIRGRVKLVEINQAFRVLWNHFKQEGNSEPLSTSSMYKMGLRVSGQTGEAKLKVLRALKLLSISKSGDVKLL